MNQSIVGEVRATMRALDFLQQSPQFILRFYIHIADVVGSGLAAISPEFLIDDILNRENHAGNRQHFANLFEMLQFTLICIDIQVFTIPNELCVVYEPFPVQVHCVSQSVTLSRIPRAAKA